MLFIGREKAQIADGERELTRRNEVVVGMDPRTQVDGGERVFLYLTGHLAWSLLSTYSAQSSRHERELSIPKHL